MIIVKNFPSVGNDSTIDDVAEITGLTQSEIKQRYETFETPGPPIRLEVFTKSKLLNGSKFFSIDNFNLTNEQWQDMTYSEKKAAIQSFFSSDEQVTNINEIEL